MLSEEEKKAIEETKRKIKNTQEGLNKGRYYGERYNLEQEIKREEILLNLIDKLQIQVEESEKALVRERKFKNKEISRLQKENEELKDYKERTEHTIMLAKATQRENEKLKEQLKAFTGIEIY